VTVIRALATHQIIGRVHPRPVTERDELGMAIGTALDATLSKYSYDASQGRRPTATSMARMAEERLAEEFRDAHLAPPPEERRRIVEQMTGVVQAFRKSPVFGLPRPRTRLILVNGSVGVYAQPDYWDGRARFFEMKSYRATFDHPDVALQMAMFQLAFPTLQGHLIACDRHAAPVRTELLEAPPLSPTRRVELLQQALRIGLELGEEKVLEYIDSPLVPYTVPA
jgi:hypothetical protein